MSRHHQLIKNDPRWKAAKRAAHERDGWACVGQLVAECTGDAGPIEADHVTRLEDAPHLAFELDNLQTLCVPCHKQKEREYAESRLIRNTWINPAYPELRQLLDQTEKESEENEYPVF